MSGLIATTNATGAFNERLIDHGPRTGWRVAIASDVRLYTEGLTYVFPSDGRLQLCTVADTAEGAVAAVDDADIDALLLDGSMVGACAAVEAIRRRHPALAIIIFSAPEDDDDVLRFVEAGATAFAARRAPSSELIETTLSAVVAHSSPAARGSMDVLLRLARRAAALPASADLAPNDLTRREREIAGLLDTGLSNKEIACRLHISVATVKNHVHRVLEKLRVRRRGQAGHRLRQQPDQRI